ncbi:MAG: cell division protein ZapA [Pseudomonadota bacterium]
MAQVDIVLNGRSYKITCEDGQEKRLERLAVYLGAHVCEIAKDLGGIGEARLLLLSALTVCDELFEAKAALKASEEKLKAHDQQALADARQMIDAATERVHALADTLAEPVPTPTPVAGRLAG